MSTTLRERRSATPGRGSITCHTCISNGVICDGQRPRCGTCISKGIDCGGSAMPLSWDSRRIWLGQSSQVDISRDDHDTRAVLGSNPRSRIPRERGGYIFRFFDPGARASKRRRTGPSFVNNSDVIRPDSSPNTPISLVSSTQDPIHLQPASVIEMAKDHQEIESEIYDVTHTASETSATHAIPNPISTPVMDNASIWPGNFSRT